MDHQLQLFQVIIQQYQLFMILKNKKKIKKKILPLDILVKLLEML